MRSLLLLLGLVLPGLALPGVAHADEDEAKTCMRAKVQDAYGQGWSVRTSTTATINAGEVDVYALTLQQGNEYTVMACGDAQLSQVGLFIYDADGQVVAQAAGQDREPRTTLTPGKTGKFYVVVQAAAMAGDAPSAAVSTAVTYK